VADRARDPDISFSGGACADWGFAFVLSEEGEGLAGESLTSVAV
jgi:hypothetical protein